MFLCFDNLVIITPISFLCGYMFVMVAVMSGSTRVIKIYIHILLYLTAYPIPNYQFLQYYHTFETNSFHVPYISIKISIKHVCTILFTCYIFRLLCQYLYACGCCFCYFYNTYLIFVMYNKSLIPVLTCPLKYFVCFGAHITHIYYLRLPCNYYSSCTYWLQVQVYYTTSLLTPRIFLWFTLFIP